MFLFTVGWNFNISSIWEWNKLKRTFLIYYEIWEVGNGVFLPSCYIPLLMHYSYNISHCRWLMLRNRYSYFHHRINLCKNHLHKHLWKKIAVYGGWLESWFLEQLDLCKLFGHSMLIAYLSFPNQLSKTKKTN